MQLAPGEYAWLLLQLEELSAKMPYRSRYEPMYDATSWDLEDLFRAFREETLSFREPIWSAVCERAMTGKWPKLSREAVFWLRERLVAARQWCEVVLQKANSSDPIRATRPKDGRAAIEWLLLELWHEHLADFWLRENARRYVSIHWPMETDEEGEADLERYLRKLEAG